MKNKSYCSTSSLIDALILGILLSVMAACVFIGVTQCTTIEESHAALTRSFELLTADTEIVHTLEKKELLESYRGLATVYKQVLKDQETLKDSKSTTIATQLLEALRLDLVERTCRQIATDYDQPACGSVESLRGIHVRVNAERE